MQSFNRMQDIMEQMIEEEYKSKERLQEAEINQQKSSLLYLKIKSIRIFCIIH